MPSLFDSRPPGIKAKNPDFFRARYSQVAKFWPVEWEKKGCAFKEKGHAPHFPFSTWAQVTDWGGRAPRRRRLDPQGAVLPKREMSKAPPATAGHSRYKLLNLYPLHCRCSFKRIPQRICGSMPIKKESFIWFFKNRGITFIWMWKILTVT